jgi:ribosomal protein S9
MNCFLNTPFLINTDVHIFGTYLELDRGGFAIWLEGTRHAITKDIVAHNGTTDWDLLALILHCKDIRVDTRKLQSALTFRRTLWIRHCLSLGHVIVLGMLIRL